MPDKNDDSFLETKLMLASVLFWISTALTFIVIYQPQCPDYYSQAQVDVSNCIVGANIGASLATLVLFPYFLVLCVLWGKKIIHTLKHPHSKKK